MAGGRRVGRLSHRDTLRQNDKAQRFLAAMSGREVPPELLNNVPPKRERAAPQPTGVPLEKDILKECLAALRAHPKVAFVGRFNRGAALDTNERGEKRYTFFNSVPGFPDIHGMLEGGRAFYIECKRQRGGRLDDKQSNFLAIITACGGIAGVATSAAEALALIAPPI